MNPATLQAAAVMWESICCRRSYSRAARSATGSDYVTRAKTALFLCVALALLTGVAADPPARNSGDEGIKQLREFREFIKAPNVFENLIQKKQGDDFGKIIEDKSPTKARRRRRLSKRG